MRGGSLMARQLRSVIGAFCKRCILTTALLACASPVLARTARVPGDFWTIQAAVDYLAQFYVGDTVLVAAGYYPERVVIPDAIRLEGIPAPGSAEPVPRIDELHIQPPRSGRYAIEVVGIHVAGPARTAGSDGPARVYFESCRFDEGMEGGNWYPDIEIISMRRCTLLGTVSLKAVETVVESCTVKAPLVLLAVGAVVTDNQFENIPGFAATISTEQDAHVARNTVRGGDAGFKVRTTEYYLAIEDNVIEGCKGPGIVSESAWYGSTIDRNHISRCGGTGISAYGVLRLNGNRVFDCGGHGLDLVQFEHAALVAGNVVGRCGGDGIRLQRDWDESSVFQVRGNTAYACAGSGIVGLATASISNNIAFRNGGSGLETGGTDVVTSSCNDWFENRAGSNSSGAPSTTDLSLDPIFCDLAADDVHLRSDSPLLNAPGCGLIGALGQGCEAPVVAMGFELWPRVVQPNARARWITAWLEPPAPFAFSEIDVATVRVNGVAVADGTGCPVDRVAVLCMRDFNTLPHTPPYQVRSL